MSITTVGDSLIHYEALGRGKPLIFVHGWLGSWRYWWPSMQALSPHYRTFAPDLWGFGDSSKAREKYSLASYVTMVNDFVERLGIVEPVILVGHGLGAAVALKYASTYPEGITRVAAVALPINGFALNKRALRGDELPSVSRFMGRVNSYPEVEAEVKKTDPLALTSLLDETEELDFMADLQNLTCPLLLVFGDQDPLVEQPNGEYSALRKPKADRAYVTLPTCMHFPMLEETAKFNRLILEFLHSEDDVSGLSPKDYWKRRTY
ncbi:MAG TPA: alpha/beta hydrolase [Candidatus Binatia bacterium]|jgi:pimeloyl-ACP methyl ester carboxylesterase|nr:alpha/beta hydrolase [Candidatus Binatia bacterium]